MTTHPQHAWANAQTLLAQEYAELLHWIPEA
jgi:hypothetical protein